MSIKSIKSAGISTGNYPMTTDLHRNISFSCDFLVVAGGGEGGAGGQNFGNGGGAGAGGFRTSYGTGNINGGGNALDSAKTIVLGVEYGVVIGAGGSGGSSSASGNSNPGGSSVFADITSRRIVTGKHLIL